jgi:hypothetical protein
VGTRGSQDSPDGCRLPLTGLQRVGAHLAGLDRFQEARQGLSESTSDTTQVALWSNCDN